MAKYEQTERTSGAMRAARVLFESGAIPLDYALTHDADEIAQVIDEETGSYYLLVTCRALVNNSAIQELAAIDKSVYELWDAARAAVERASRGVEIQWWKSNLGGHRCHIFEEASGAWAMVFCQQSSIPGERVSEIDKPCKTCSEEAQRRERGEQPQTPIYKRPV